MYDSTMPYCYIRADLKRSNFILYMQQTTILNVCPLSDSYRTDIAANHCIKPDAGLLTNFHITDNHRPVGD